MSPQQQSSGEKTEKATPRKRREARKEGQVSKSTEVITALSLMLMFGVLGLFGAGMADNLKKLLTHFFTARAPEQFDMAATASYMKDAMWMFAQIMLPLLAAAMIGGILFNVVQVGFLFTTKAMAPKIDRISPISGFKRIFSMRTLLDLAKAIIKITILAVVGYGEYEYYMDRFAMLMPENIQMATTNMTDSLIAVAFKLGIALAIFAPFDYIYQRWKHNKDLMMTKQEVKDEYKLTEGDPQVKGKIAQKQRQMSRMRMVQAVKDADVVITNPTHYAVALAYKEQKHTAPMVVAKGMDHLAQRIKEEAKTHFIEIVENKPLAQSLYFFCEVGDEVPEDMYKAVAEVLAYVYRLKTQGGRA